MPLSGSGMPVAILSLATPDHLAGRKRGDPEETTDSPLSWAGPLRRPGDGSPWPGGQVTTPPSPGRPWRSGSRRLDAEKETRRAERAGRGPRIGPLADLFDSLLPHRPLPWMAQQRLREHRPAVAFRSKQPSRSAPPLPPGFRRFPPGGPPRATPRWGHRHTNAPAAPRPAVWGFF